MQPTEAQIEDFKRNNPERAQALLEEGAAQERDRWRGLEAVAADLGPMHAPLVKAMKADGRYTGADLAVAVVASMQGVQGAHSVDRLAIQREANKEWNENPNIREAFGAHNKSAFSAYRAATANRP